MENIMNAHMVRSPYVADPEMSPKEALDIMKELDFRHLPVVSEGRLKGIVSERDLREATQLSQADQLRLEDVMKTDVYCVQKDTPLKRVILEMTDRKLGSVIVLNTRKEVVGIFTTIDALRILSEFLDESSKDEIILKDDFFESWEDFTPLNA